MEAVITNVWSQVRRDELTRSETSRIVVEATAAPQVIVQGDGLSWTLRFGGVRLNMPASRLDVADGFVSDVTVAGGPPRVAINLDFPGAPVLRRVPGMPDRTVAEFDRRPLLDLFARRRILIDPGHGGADTGGKGPIDLLEKHLVLAIAFELAYLCERTGAKARLTRETDIYLSDAERRGIAERFRPEVIIGVHTNWSSKRQDGGTSTSFADPSQAGLAEAIQSGMVRKLRLRDLGARQVEDPGPYAGLPAVNAECVTISNPVEEGWLRGNTFLIRVAQGIFNGLAIYWRGLDRKL